MASEEERDQLPEEVPPEETPAEPSREREVLDAGEHALPEMFISAQKKEGANIGMVGAPGSGKTFGANIVVNRLLDDGIVRLVLTLDAKGREPQYAGGHLRSNPGPPWSAPPRFTYFGNPADAQPLFTLAAAPLADGSRYHVIFRGNPRMGELADGEAIAQMGLHLARTSDFGVCVTIDELDTVLTDGGKNWQAPSVRVVSSQGRSINAWLVWTTQQPQRIPSDIYDQAKVICLFRLEAKAVKYLDRVCMLDDRMLAELGTLPEGVFVIHRAGRPWDGKFYKF